MPGTTTPPDIELIIEPIRGGGGGQPPVVIERGYGGGNDGNKQPRKRPPSPRRYYTGITLAIVSVLMFFMALASAYIVRRGSGDWVPVHVPWVIWANTGVLLLSSLTIEVARRALSKAHPKTFRIYWNITTFLGVLFLAGQIFAWRMLVQAGVFVASNPASSFFYVVTGAHALHLIGGVFGLLFVALRDFNKAKINLHNAAEITSYYWHFMDALWIFLLLLLYLGK